MRAQPACSHKEDSEPPARKRAFCEVAASISRCAHAFNSCIFFPSNIAAWVWITTEQGTKQEPLRPRGGSKRPHVALPPESIGIFRLPTVQPGSLDQVLVGCTVPVQLATQVDRTNEVSRKTDLRQNLALSQEAISYCDESPCRMANV